MSLDVLKKGSAWFKVNKMAFQGFTCVFEIMDVTARVNTGPLIHISVSRAPSKVLSVYLYSLVLSSSIGIYYVYQMI